MSVKRIRIGTASPRSWSRSTSRLRSTLRWGSLVGWTCRWPCSVTEKYPWPQRGTSYNSAASVADHGVEPGLAPVVRRPPVSVLIFRINRINEPSSFFSADARKNVACVDGDLRAGDQGPTPSEGYQRARHHLRRRDPVARRPGLRRRSAQNCPASLRDQGDERRGVPCARFRGRSGEFLHRNDARGTDVDYGEGRRRGG